MCMNFGTANCFGCTNERTIAFVRSGGTVIAQRVSLLVWQRMGAVFDYKRELGDKSWKVDRERSVIHKVSQRNGETNQDGGESDEAYQDDSGMPM
jgi:hypothetical protein